MTIKAFDGIDREFEIDKEFENELPIVALAKQQAKEINRENRKYANLVNYPIPNGNRIVRLHIGMLMSDGTKQIPHIIRHYHVVGEEIRFFDSIQL